MTLRKKLESLAQENGLWPQEAEQIADALIAEDASTSGTMSGRWNDEEDAYPPQLVAVLWMSYKRVADKWLGEHKPMHWARPMFSGNLE